MYDTIFSVANNVALVGWVGLALLPGVHLVTNVIARWVIPFSIAALYATLLVMHWSAAPEGADLGTIDGIQSFFSVDGLMLAGWMHFIAWDLFAASWIMEDSRRIGIWHLFMLPCLALTYLLGPNALLLYVPMRLVSSYLMGRRADATTT